MAKLGFFVFLVAAAIGLCLAGEHGPKKCKGTSEEEEIFKECYKEVMEKDFDPATFMENPMSEEQSAELRLCFAKHKEVVDESGKYNHEKMMEGMETAEFEDESIKTALIEEITKCDGEGVEDVPALLKCHEEAFIKHCMPA